MSSANNIELHTTYGVRDTLGSLKEELARLEREEEKAREGQQQQSSTLVDGGGISNNSNNISSSDRHHFPSAASTPITATSLSTLRKKDAADVIASEEQRAEANKQALMRELVADEVLLGRAADRERRSVERRRAEGITAEDEVNDYSPPSPPTPAAAEMTYSSSVVSVVAPPLLTTMQERVRDDLKAADRISAASHIRHDVTYIADIMRLRREEEALEELQRSNAERKSLLALTEALGAAEGVGRRAIEAEWFSVGYEIGEVNLSSSSSSSPAASSSSVPIVPAYSKLALGALLMPPTRQKAAFAEPAFHQHRRMLQQYLSTRGVGVGGSGRPLFDITATTPRPISAASSSTPTAAGRGQTMGTTTNTINTTNNGGDAAAIVVYYDHADDALCISIAEAFYLCAVVAEEATQFRIASTLASRRAEEWAVSEAQHMSDLDAVLFTERDSIKRAKEAVAKQPLRDSSTLPTGDFNDAAMREAYAGYGFAHTDVQYGYGAANKVSGYANYHQHSSVGVVGHGNDSASQQQSRVILGANKPHHSHPNAFYATAAEREAEEQRAAKAQLSAGKWRARVFDDEVTRAVYYASSLEFRSTEKMARYL